VVNFTPRSLYPQGKSPWYSLYRRLGGTQIRSGHGGEEKNFQISSLWRYSNLLSSAPHPSAAKANSGGHGELYKEAKDKTTIIRMIEEQSQDP
jgi:hypothetical protein